jgi:hypothetical protein
MKSKTLAFVLVDLEISKIHSHPYIPNDNPISESQFKTMKCHPSYPERFYSLLQVRTGGKDFFFWNNNCHHHSRIALLTACFCPFMSRAKGIISTSDHSTSRLSAASGEFYVWWVASLPEAV